MSKVVRSDTQWIQHLVESPDAVDVIRSMPATALSAMIERVGIDEVGTLVALARTEQLVELFDEGVFEGDELDPARFSFWLEALLEAGEGVALEHVASLPDDLLRAAFASYVHVLDLDSMALQMSEDEGLSPLNDHLENVGAEELAGYLVVPTRSDGWDAIWTVLVGLSVHRTERLEVLLEGVLDATMDRVREEGLSAALMGDERLNEDATAGREERRAKLGHVSASDARAFLRLARTDGDPDRRDAITHAWLRRVEGAPLGAPLSAIPHPALHAEGRRALPSPAPSANPSDRLRSALSALAVNQPETHAARMEELLFLANVVHADSRSVGPVKRPVEALEEVLAVCGKALVVRARSERDDVNVLEGRSLDLLFRDGLRPSE